MTERAESLTRARTWPAALESLVRSQRNGANDRGRSCPSSLVRARSSGPVTEGVLERISRLVFDVAVQLTGSLRRCSRQITHRLPPALKSSCF
jgi:hypothetical protein